MGWEIVKHSFAMLFRNLGNAMRVSLGPIAIALLIAFAIISLLQVSAVRVVYDVSRGEISSNVAFAVILLMVVFFFVSAWIAVSWHRFILLEEYPGLLPPLKDRPVWPYVGKTFLLALVMMAAMIPALIVTSLLTGVFGATPGIFSILGIGLALYFSYMWLRFGLVLPAIALSRPMSFTEAWKSTGPHSNAILGTGALLILINSGVALVSSVMPGALSVLLDLVSSWITVMVGTSVLTTLYGVIVERRTLG
jgi:hypothetical protein